MRAFKLIVGPLLRRAARRTLVGRNRSAHHPDQGRFTRADVERLVRVTWQNFDALAPTLPREPTPGSRLAVTLAGLTLAFYRALVADGCEPATATALVADGTWYLYEKPGRLWYAVARLSTRDPLRRLRIAAGLFRWFPFNPPGFLMADRPDANAVVFTVHRCPVAEYMRAHGAADLCVASWCHLDYPLAELWGGRLDRTTTLATGGPGCDFRWRVGSPQDPPTPPGC